MAGGRPTKYKPEYAEQARKLCDENASTDLELANSFGVALSTIKLWKSEHPEFSAALKNGKAPANERVARSLYERAMGYSQTETDLRVINGVLMQTEVLKHYPPDPVAMIFWLKNREPDQWRDKQELEVDLKMSLGERMAAARKRAGLADEEQG